MTDALRLDGVCKHFGQVRAVEALSLRIPGGRICGFLGPNGAGKTTTLRMVMNIISPDEGRIEVLGQPSRRLEKSRVGYMPEERGLYRRMTVEATLAYFGAIKGLPAGELTRRIPRWLERVGLPDCAPRRVEEMSRGMHQKLQFAVTCIGEPDLLILDEPFAGLDPVNLELLKGIILDLRRQGKTVLFSTHGMHEAEELCDSICLIDKGRLVLEGTLEQVRSRWASPGTVVVELEGEAAFPECPALVKSVRRDGPRLEIELADGADPQQLLAALVGRVRIQSFQVKKPTLHEIFLRTVGRNHDGQDP